MFRHKIFSFNVLSDINLVIPQINFDNEDVRVRFRKPINREKVDKDVINVTMNKEGKITMDITNVAVFEVINFKEIIIFPYSDKYHLNEILLYLMGTVFSIILFFHNKFILHGSCIAIGDLGVVFTGESGVGKSTLARGFIKKEYLMLSDDLAAIDRDEEINVISSFPKQKLWEDSINNFDLSKNDEDKVFNRDNKFNVNVSSQCFTNKVKLGAVILINKRDDVEEVTLRRVDNKESLQILLNNSYRSEFIGIIGLLSQHLVTMSLIAMNTKVYILTRPTNRFTVNKQIELVVNAIQGG